MQVRADNKQHKGRCRKCASKLKWKNIGYIKKNSESHKGNKLTKEAKNKISKANKGRIKSPKECKNISEGRKKEYGLASAKHIFSRYKYNAKKRKHIFVLTIDEFIAITSKNCRYCGSPPGNRSKPHDKVNGEYIHSGIDRLDNKIGYTVENSVPCCTHCNYAKHTMSEDEFRRWGKRLYDNFITNEILLVQDK